MRIIFVQNEMNQNSYEWSKHGVDIVNMPREDAFFPFLLADAEQTQKSRQEIGNMARFFLTLILHSENMRRDISNTLS